MENNYNHKIMHKESGKCQKEPTGIETENRDSIITIVKKILGKDKNQSDIQDLTQFAWP